VPGGWRVWGAGAKGASSESLRIEGAETMEQQAGPICSRWKANLLRGSRVRHASVAGHPVRQIKWLTSRIFKTTMCNTIFTS